MSHDDKILEALRLGLGHLSGEDRAAHLRMHLRQVGIEAGHPARIEDGDLRVSVEAILASGEPCAHVEVEDEMRGIIAILGTDASRRLAAHLLLAAFDAEELAKLPRPAWRYQLAKLPRPAWRYQPPEVNAETDRGDLDPGEEP